ncbi:MAG TPA: MerR family transcriptional regulator [Candidatus Saccharimonadales bacterium]|nr:MerR family transcriptional regulator [Candidatus Saccharimonadales bacterium]
MEPARPTIKKLVTLQQAAEKLAVSVDTLLSWNEHHILKPTISSDGQIGYTEEQLDQFSKIKRFSSPPEYSVNEIHEPHSSNIPAENTPTDFPSEAPSNIPGKLSLYHTFIKWVGNGFYTDEFIKNYLMSQVRQSLTLTIQRPSLSFKRPSKKTTSLALGIITVLAIGLGTQQYRIKFLVEKYQGKFQYTTSNQVAVLGAQTSKLKLVGNIIFRLPLSLKKDVRVEGKSTFDQNITAPNVLYGIKAGKHISITDQASQTPTISVDLEGTVTSLQGQSGDVQLLAGQDIAIDGLTINDTSTLDTVTSRGDCSACITAGDVATDLVISSGGQVSAQAIKGGVLNTNVGGTGLTTYNSGDLIYAMGSGTLASLPIGTQNGQILQVSNGVPSWSSISLDAPGSNPTNSGASLVGVFNNFSNSTSTNLQQVLQDLDTSITSAGISPFVNANDTTYGNFIHPADITNSFVLGGNGTPTGSALFFNASKGTLGLGTTNNDLDVDGNPFTLEVHGSIGPDQNGVYDLGSPTQQYRNLYLTGQTTSGGSITIANPNPSITFTDTDLGQNQYIVSVDNSQFSLQNSSTGNTALVINANGDVDLAGGSTSTGCTVINSTGGLNCAGTVVTTGGLTIAGTAAFSGLTNNGPVYTSVGGVLNSEAQLSPIRGGTGVDGSTAVNGSLLIGNGSGFSLATLTSTANQIIVTNSVGGITLSLPQDIAATSSPTFSSLTVNAATNQLTLGPVGNSASISVAPQTAPRTITIPSLNASDTFIFANQPDTLSNKTIGSTGLIFSGATSDITTASNANLTIAPSGSGAIILSKTTQLGFLPSAPASATSLCRDNITNEITACPANASNTTLQLAYDSGNIITTTDSRNIAITLASGLTTPTSFTVTNAGTANAFVLNDTNAATNTSFAIQSGGTNSLTINENGTLSTAGNILTTGGGTILSNGLLTASNGFTQTTGALNITATSGTLALSGLSASSINTGANNLLITANNFNTTATGINATAIGATSPSTGAFTTLADSALITAGIVTNNASGVLSTTAQVSVAQGGTGLDNSTAANGTLLIGNGTGFSLAGLIGTTNQINVTNGAGSITLSTPQDIAITSSPAFAALGLSNTTNQLVLGTTSTTTISSIAPAASRIATIPALSGNDTFVFANQAQTLTNKALDDSTTLFQNTTDTTKQVVFDLSQISTGTTRTITIPDASGAVCVTAGNCAGVGGSVGGT